MRRGQSGRRKEKEVTAAKLNCLSSRSSVRVRPFFRSFFLRSFSGNAQERKLDYGNEAEKKFAGGAERKRIREGLDGLCEGAL